MNVDLAEIQREIEALPAEQVSALIGWLAERDRLEWDAQIERDFSPGGAGMDLLSRVKSQVSRGESEPMAECRNRRWVSARLRPPNSGRAYEALTMDLYGHVFEASDKESAERMQRIFGSLSASPATANDDKVVVQQNRRKRA